MKQVRIGIASTNAAKLGAVRDALARLAAVEAVFAGAPELVARGVATGVTGTPMSDAETLEGARQRAEGLFATLAREGAPVDYAIGLEGGLDEVRHRAGRAVVLRSWAYVTNGREGACGAGGGLVLPEWIVARVRDGEELGDVIDALAGEPVRGTRGAWGVFTRDLISRRDAFAAAVVSAFARFYNAALYEEGSGL